MADIPRVMLSTTIQGQRRHLNSILLGSNQSLSPASKDHWQTQARLPPAQVTKAKIDNGMSNYQCWQLKKKHKIIMPVKPTILNMIRRKYGEVPPTPGLLINRAKLDQKNAAGRTSRIFNILFLHLLMTSFNRSKTRVYK